MKKLDEKLFFFQKIPKLSKKNFLGSFPAESPFSCCHKPDALSGFEYRVVSSALMSILRIQSSVNSLMYLEKVYNQEWSV